MDEYIASALTRGPLSHKDLLGWMIDTISALRHLHHSGNHVVVHRDLKPPNFLVVRRKGEAGAGAGCVYAGQR